jgi:DNA-binding winged helix-turn-helix (wHTH) protein/dipeptidyl aminopeptidase/acylaminoacyl peptidase
MKKQYWIGGFFIELSRNQITQNDQSQTIAPKALAVLTYLAENQGKVVSHDELLDKVWPDTVVSPNTLQRSIAQLRKALGDDGKVQAYIKTHAKQGYSLECDVRWQDNIDAESLINQDSLSDVNTNNSIAKDITSAEPQAHKVTQSHINNNYIDRNHNTKSTRPTLWLIFLFAVIVVIGFLGVKYLTPTQSSKLSFGELRALTATDNKEHSGIYSPDGEHIIFLRYSEEFCMSSNIWAKNTKTQKETQLTKNMGRYGSPSFSKDGKKIVFIKTEHCDEPITQKECYKLMTLDFEKALEGIQSLSLLMECKNSRIAMPRWLNNNNIALLQEFSNRWKLTNYSIVDNKSTVIYEQEDGNFIYYDYSVTDDLIALTSIHNDGQNYIEILEPDGHVLSSYQIQYPPEIPSSRFISPNFTPMSEHLIFSTGRLLFTLSYEGKITNISLPLDEPMSSPIFHPQGRRMIITKGNWDSDIAKISLSQLTNSKLTEVQTDQANQTLILKDNNYSIIERSNLGEDDAIYQPNGELIAFESDRSGNDQIWLSDVNGDGNNTKQLTHFPIDTYIDGFDWDADGQSFLVNANKTLIQVDLDSKQKPFLFGHRIEQLFQWNSQDNTALVIARIKGVRKFGEFNLNNSEFRVITDKKIKWALKSQDGSLIYTDQMDRFWQPGPAEDQLIDLLDGQGSDNRFILKHNVIYGINEEFQLWSYDLNEETFVILGDIPKNIDNLTDINQTDILISVRISAKKELAELFLTD